jgi:hypothetical protein
MDRAASSRYCVMQSSCASRLGGARVDHERSRFSPSSSCLCCSCAHPRSPSAQPWIERSDDGWSFIHLGVGVFTGVLFRKHVHHVDAHALTRENRLCLGMESSSCVHSRCRFEGFGVATRTKGTASMKCDTEGRSSYKHGIGKG